MLDIKIAPEVFLIVLLVFCLSQSSLSQEKTKVENIWTLPYKQCWVIKESIDSIASDNETEIYLSFSNGKVKKVNTKTSEEIWETDLGNKANSEIFLKSSFLLTSTNINERNGKKITVITEVSKKTGLTNLRINLGSDDIKLIKEIEEKILVEDQLRNEIILLEPKSEKIVWSRNFKDNLLNKILVIDDKILVATETGKINMLSIIDGNSIFEVSLKDTISDFYFDGIKKVVVGDLLGNVFTFDIYNKKQIKVLRAGGKITNFSKVSENVLVSSSDNFIYLISSEKGKILWKRRLSGKVEGKPVVSGNIAFLFLFGKGFVVDLKKGEIINQLSNISSDFIIGSPIIQNTAIFIPYSSGLYKFDVKDCKQ